MNISRAIFPIFTQASRHLVWLGRYLSLSRYLLLSYNYMLHIYFNSIIVSIQLMTTKQCFHVLLIIVHLIPGEEMADGRRDVNWGTDLDRSADDEHDDYDGHGGYDEHDGHDGHHLLICSEFCITHWCCSIIMIFIIISFLPFLYLFEWNWLLMLTISTCDDVERIRGWGEGGRGGNSQRWVANHWHRMTPDHH